MLNLRKGTELKERYVVHDVLGTGGYASVWKASDKQLNRDVALKRLLKRSTTTTAEEISALLEERVSMHIWSTQTSSRFTTSSKKTASI